MKMGSKAMISCMGLTLRYPVLNVMSHPPTQKSWSGMLKIHTKIMEEIYLVGISDYLSVG